MKRGKFENVNGRSFRNLCKEGEISPEKEQENKLPLWNGPEESDTSPEKEQENDLPLQNPSEEGKASSEEEQEKELPLWNVPEESNTGPEEEQEDDLPFWNPPEKSETRPEEEQEESLPPRNPPEAGKTNSGKKQEKPLDPRKNALLYLHDIVYLMAGLILVLLLLFRVAVVSGTSMNDTLVDGDYLLVLGNVFYTHPKQGDIIVASKASFDNGTPIVKRVIATEGQTVDIDFDAGIVYVDDVALDEPYITTLTTQAEGVVFPLTVEEGCVFVMGDNRYISKDSRSPEIGLIDTREILGKAILLFFPGTDKGATQRQFDRIGALT